MFEAITHFSKLLLDRSIKFHKKLLWIISIFLTLLFFNDVFDISHSIISNSKLERLETIHKLITDTTLTIEQRNYLVYERNRAFSHTPFTIKAYNSLLSFFRENSFFTKRTASLNPNTNNNTTKNNAIVSIMTKNYLWNYVSCNFFLFIILLASLVGVYQSETTFYAKFWINLGLIVSFYFLSVINAGIFNLIPVLGYPFVNYILNFAFHLLLFTVLVNRFSDR